MVIENYNTARKLGLTTEETAKLELATSLAILSSGAYTTWWLLYHIYSDSSVLETVRKELLGITDLNDTTHQRRHTPKTNTIKVDCPTLVALLYETCGTRLHTFEQVQAQEECLSSGP